MQRPASFLSVSRVLTLAVLASLAASSAAQSARAAPGLSAFRPQHGAAYAPFERTKVPERFEEDPLFGPGIRVNGAGELDPAGEDDLVELLVAGALDSALVLERSGPELALWGTRTKEAGTAIVFTGNRSAPIAFGPSAHVTLWVEWSAATPGLATLALRALEPDRIADRLLFHAFHGLVVALGGEGQVPQVPVDSNHGTFLVATELYERGFDVDMRDEDDVRSDGSGAAYDAVVNAVQHRGVTQLAIFGYSHGGGSTYDLALRLDNNRATIGTFAIPFTSYVDGIENDSDSDVDMELRRPVASGFHANHYQRGSLADFFLDGGPVPVSNPLPSGLDVQTTGWGDDSTHFEVDDFTEVRGFILTTLEPRMSR